MARGLSKWIGLLVGALTVAVSAPIAAAQDARPAQQSQPDLAALSRLIEEQRKQLEEQSRLIEDLKNRLDATSKAVAASQQRLTELEQKSAVTPEIEQRLTEIEHRVPELTPQELSQAQEFPGSFRIPGTEAGI